ncbi:MAG: response regulator transcription factor [Spirochaetes bacterium]|nr:response regulator transcription factor [Spirochaetota bacterium]
MTEKKANILVIEDEPTIIEFLRTGLRYEGYDVLIAPEGKRGFDLAKHRGADLIILDLMLPDIDGMEICKKLRAGGNRVPIIILTAKTSVTDRVSGLDTGADDYITKPFSFEELVARVRALLRRTGHESEKTLLEIEDIILNVESMEVTRDGSPVHLTPAEFSLLELFMRHPKRVFTRETLLNRIFGYDFAGDTNIVDVHISHLRDKIKDKPPKLIRTVYGSGYSLQPERE